MSIITQKVNSLLKDLIQHITSEPPILLPTVQTDNAEIPIATAINTPLSNNKSEPNNVKKKVDVLQLLLQGKPIEVASISVSNDVVYDASGNMSIISDNITTLTTDPSHPMKFITKETNKPRNM
jgi:hypothetical protein